MRGLTKSIARIVLWALMLGVALPDTWWVPVFTTCATILVIMYTWDLFWWVRDWQHHRRWKRVQERNATLARIPRRTIQPPDDPTYLRLDRSDS